MFYRQLPVRSWDKESSAWALVQPGKWTLGALVNNVWSVAGPSDRTDVKQMTLQYFVNYNLKKGWYLSFAPVITANWKASNGNVWAVPVGGGVGRILRLGFQPVNVSAQFYGNAGAPAERLELVDAPANRVPLSEVISRDESKVEGVAAEVAVRPFQTWEQVGRRLIVRCAVPLTSAIA